MRAYITHQNTGLFLLKADRLQLNDQQKEFLVWSKLFDTFHFDPQADFHFVFIDHPLESYVGCSLKAHPDMLEEKMKRYSEGLAHQLVYYFPESKLETLSEEKTTSVIHQLLKGMVPETLCEKTDDQLPFPEDQIRILFARIVDPRLIMEKFLQFYSKEIWADPTGIEQKEGFRPVCDERIMSILEHAYLAYSFTIYNSDDHKPPVLETDRHSVPMPFVQEFIQHMGVPDMFLEGIKKARSTQELFDRPGMVLVSPEVTAEFLLGYR